MATDTLPNIQLINVGLEAAEHNLVRFQGALKAINLVSRICQIYLSETEYITCLFDDEMVSLIRFALD